MFYRQEGGAKQHPRKLRRSTYTDCKEQAPTVTPDVNTLPHKSSSGSEAGTFKSERPDEGYVFLCDKQITCRWRNEPWFWQQSKCFFEGRHVCLCHLRDTRARALATYAPVGNCCEINSANILLCNWNEIYQENNSKTLFPCNSLNHKRIRVMQLSGN